MPGGKAGGCGARCGTRSADAGRRAGEGAEGLQTRHATTVWQGDWCLVAAGPVSKTTQ